MSGGLGRSICTSLAWVDVQDNPGKGPGKELGPEGSGRAPMRILHDMTRAALGGYIILM